MIIRLLKTLCCVLFLSDGVLAENEIKTGHHPFMAFIYYPDERVIEETGARYIRGAVLVKPEWLISSTVGPVMTDDLSLGFPRKTLMARLGARSIEANFTLNEDEDEQEREVIQIIRPYNYSATQWWRDDISLLKTLVPFNLTAAVATATIRSEPSTIKGSCYILVFAKRFGNLTDDKVLMQLYVEMQPSSVDACGLHFYQDTMVCATDSDENKNTIYDPQFCQGNSGGPLVCDNEVTGIQTYIENDCKQPHLYQLLSAWKNFITCSIEEKCSENTCLHTCLPINKDDPLQEELITQARMDLVSAASTTVTEQITIPVRSSTEMISDDDDITSPKPSLSTAFQRLITVGTTTTTTASTTIATSPTTTTKATLHSSEYTVESAWPKEKNPERMKSFEEDEEKIERKTSVEAQEKHKSVKKYYRSAADRNECVFKSVFTVCILVSLM